MTFDTNLPLFFLELVQFFPGRGGFGGGSRGGRGGFGGGAPSFGPPESVTGKYLLPSLSLGFHSVASQLKQGDISANYTGSKSSTLLGEAIYWNIWIPYFSQRCISRTPSDPLLDAPCLRHRPILKFVVLDCRHFRQLDYHGHR